MTFLPDDLRAPAHPAYKWGPDLMRASGGAPCEWRRGATGHP